MSCICHPEREACPQTEGWRVELCESCHWFMGSPEREPSFGAAYGISSVVLAAEERRHEHPEVQAYRSHFQIDNTVRVAS